MLGGIDPAMLQQMMGGAGGFPGAAATQAPADTRPPREKYAEQLQQVKEMGFHDEEQILKALEECNGNVQLAIEKIFTQLGSQ